MEIERLTNRHCLAMARCSTKKQAALSLPQQDAWLREQSDLLGMMHIDTILESRRVSQTKKRPDIDKIIHRKIHQNDFDILLVQDLSRLTRGGLEHGLKIYFKFQEHGIQIYSLVDGLIDGEEKLREAIKRFEEAKAQVRSNAMVQVRSKIQQRNKKKLPHCGLTPYGTDRLYLTPDGCPQYIIRNLCDGTQQQLSVDGKTVMRVFGFNDDGSMNRFSKQSGEIVKLIPGDSSRVNVLRQIFRRSFVDGWGACRIARELNDSKIPSSTGRRWEVGVVGKTLANSTYLGKGIANRLSSALFYKCGKDRPIAVDTTRENTPLQSFRPTEDWVEVNYPELENLLDLDQGMRHKIWEWQLSQMERTANRVVRKPGGDRHTESRYFLKGIAHTKQGNVALTGLSTNGYRYYHVTQHKRKPSTDSKVGRLIRADVIEPAVLDALKDTLSSHVELEQILRSAIQEQPSNAIMDDLDALKRQQDELAQQIEYYVSSLAVLGRDVVDKQVQRLSARHLEIRQKLRSLERPATSVDPEAMAASILQKCCRLATSLEGFTPTELRNVARLLIRRLVVDLETYEIELELGLPSWALKGDWNAQTAVGLVPTLPSNYVNETNNENDVSFANFHCSKLGTRENPCMKCRRQARNSQNSSNLAAIQQSLPVGTIEHPRSAIERELEQIGDVIVRNSSILDRAGPTV